MGATQKYRIRYIMELFLYELIVFRRYCDEIAVVNDHRRASFLHRVDDRIESNFTMKLKTYLKTLSKFFSSYPINETKMPGKFGAPPTTQSTANEKPIIFSKDVARFGTECLCRCKWPIWITHHLSTQ